MKQTPGWFRLCALVVALWSSTPDRIQAQGNAPPPHTIHRCGEPMVAPAAIPVPATPASTSEIELTVRVIDGDTGEPVPARLQVSHRGWPPAQPLYPERHFSQAVLSNTYLYSSDEAVFSIEGGWIVIKAMRGFEYQPVTVEYYSVVDTLIEVELTRFTDMKAKRWYSGDTHVHIAHKPINYIIDAEDLMMMISAEDLNVVNAMEELPYFTGSVDPLSSDDHILFFSKEQRNAHQSHLTIVGLRQWISDEGCSVPPGTLALCGNTLDKSVYDRVHSQPGEVLVIATHPYATVDIGNAYPWPGGGVWRGMPFDLAAGAVDAMDLLNYSNEVMPFLRDDYFHALNMGLKLPPSAGTDAVMCSGFSYPLGGYRVYVSIPEEETFSFDSWIRNLGQGRSFVTNNPLISDFRLTGIPSGGTVLHRGESLKGHIAVECAHPFEKIEIIGNGRVLSTLYPDGDGRALDRSFTIDPVGVDWVVARVTGPCTQWAVVDAEGLFAQTGPIYLDLSRGDTGVTFSRQVFPDVRRAAVEHFRDMTEEIGSLMMSRGHFDGDARARFAEAIVSTRDYYEGLEADPPAPFKLVYPLAVNWSEGRTVSNTNQPTFVWEQAHDPDPGDSVVYTIEFDLSPGFNSPAVFSGLTDTVFTVPAEGALTSGEVYYWRVRARDRTGRERMADPASWSMLVKPDPTTAGTSAPGGWALGQPTPNPFNPSVRLSVRVAPGRLGMKIDVFDSVGRTVRVLKRGPMEPGVYSVSWDGRDDSGTALPSGVYLVRLLADDGTALTRKAVLLK